ncbi:MAG: LamG-like jellyroll fold domain-containing protein, partial [Bacteroidaceae bacterium]
MFKILMDYSHRSEISIAAGIAADTSALKPEATETMPFFDYTGDGSKANPAPAVPMLGKWRTKLNYDPMEFGYDVTDLSESYDRTKPLKYFLCIKSKPTAIGSGKIYKLSLMDYEIEKEGLELPARIDTVAILNGGETTLVSVTVAGRQIYEPLNASLSGDRLTWSAPKPSSYDIVRYYIYKGSEKVAEVPNFSYSYKVDNPEATYYVAAAYDYKGKRLVSAKSRPARNAALFEPGETNYVLSLTNAALTMPGVIDEKLNEATIEFWIKPTTLDGFNQQIGERWGSFLFTMSKSGQIYCGWDTSNRISTSANTVKPGNWYHVAIVVDRNVMTVYVNGMKKGSFTSDSFSGIPALSAFHIGTADGLMNAELDEFRIWTTARTQKEIFTNRNIEVACPSGQSDLLLYYPMIKAEGQLKDMASGNDVELTNGEYVENAALLNGNNVMESAFFTWGDDAVYAGEPVQFRAASSLNAVAWEWNVPGIAGGTSKVVSPYFTFSKAGDYSVSLLVTNNKGETLDSTLTVTVVSPDAPKADFDIAVDTLAEGEMFSFANKSAGANCIYKWSLPGADVEEINSVNAGVTYSHTGVFPVTLTVTNAGGTDKMTKYVTVSHSKPAVAFSVDPAFIMLGETTYLIDETRHSPQEWQWSVTNGVHTTNITGQHTSFTPKHPGIYSVSLTAGNDMGTSELTEGNRLIVSNADSRNGLNFTGAQQCVSTKSLFESGTKAFTIEWWMNPTATMGALGMVTQNDQIKITT